MKRMYLKDLKIVEVIDEMDVPWLYTALDPDGRLWLVNLVSFIKGLPVWFAIVVSSARMAVLDAGTCDMRTAFSEPEDGCLFEIVQKTTCETCRLITDMAEAMPKLPLAGMKLRDTAETYLARDPDVSITCLLE